MQDGIEPWAHGIATPLVPSRNGAFKAVLNQIIGRGRVVQECTRITAQAGNQGLQQLNKVVQRCLLAP